MTARCTFPITGLRASAYRIPTTEPEADGTLEWDATDLVLVEVQAGGETGIGYTYADASLVRLINERFAPMLDRADPFAIGMLNERLFRSIRNLGRSGLCACAVSAVDIALWDLKARLLELPLINLLGARREEVPVYGSAGFTGNSDSSMFDRLGRWVHEQGCRWVKIKVNADVERGAQRVATARAGVGQAGLFVDANGAFDRGTAIRFAATLAEQAVDWFEEPVSSDDLSGLREVRRAVNTGMRAMDVVAGEYAYTSDDFRHLLLYEAVDVLQADATRCGGITGFLHAAALSEAFHLDLSTHCAPALHRHVACVAPRVRHIEWFHDHAHLESMLFDGAPIIVDGSISPDLSRPGHGLQFKHADAEQYAL